MSLYVPTAEVWARFAASGMTRYSLQEITAAAAEYEAAAQRYDAVASEAMAYVIENAAYGYGDMGWEHGLSADLDALYSLLDSSLIPELGSGVGNSGSSEQWPVKKWADATARYRRLIRRIERALAAAQQQQAPELVSRRQEEDKDGGDRGHGTGAAGYSGPHA